MMIPLATLLLSLQAAAGFASPVPGVQDAAYGPDGRLALAIDGDLWVQRSAPDSDFVRRRSRPPVMRM